MLHCPVNVSLLVMPWYNYLDLDLLSLVNYSELEWDWLEYYSLRLLVFSVEFSVEVDYPQRNSSTNVDVKSFLDNHGVKTMLFCVVTLILASAQEFHITKATNEKIVQ